MRTLPMMLLLAVLPLTLAAAEITGRVIDADGKPVAHARVAIDGAAPGRPGPFCPTCYAEVTKVTSADGEGVFRFSGVTGGLRYRLLAMTPRHLPALSGRGFSDPSKDIIITLVSPPKDEPARLITARVVDPNGRPVVGARVEPIDNVRALTFTNNDGIFLLRAEQPAQKMRVRVIARGYQPVVLPLEPGLEARDIALETGASFSGKLTRNGKPAKDVVVKALQLNRTFDTFLGDANEAVTDEHGVFFINGLAAVEAYRIVTVGVVPADVRTTSTGASGSNVEIGVVEIP